MYDHIHNKITEHSLVTINGAMEGIAAFTLFYFIYYYYYY